MSTITLYKDKVNGVGSLIDDIIKSSNNLNTQLGTLRNTVQGVNSSTCDLQSTVDSISSSSKSEKEKVEDLKKLNKKLTEFIELTDKRDESARDAINKSKKDFYSKYKHLKPESEKSLLEHVADGVKAIGEWCKEHWKELLIAIEIIVAVACLLIPGLEGFGILILENMLKGFVLGLLSGAVIGGISGYAQYGVDGILGGALQGAEEGAMLGMAFGGLGGVGSLMGELGGCSTIMSGVFSVSSKLSMGMMAFDSITLVNDFQTRFQMDTGINLGLIDPNVGGVISNLNHKAHSNPFYNGLQLVAGGTAVFSGGYVQTATCFVARTLVATINGLVAIENIKAGDYVLSANPDTMEIAYKPVLETYIREVDKLIHLVINGEEIISTFDHPFYVKGKGFISAEMLWIGAELINNNGKILFVEKIYREVLDNQTRTVYNFKVDEYHAYFVGNKFILVHNADYMPTKNQKGFVKSVKNDDGSITITKKIGGKEYDLNYTIGKDGHYYPRFEKYADYKNSDLPNIDFSKPIKSTKPLTGDYGTDAGYLNEQLGLSGTPNGYVWHHIEDGESMLLVPQKIHSIKYGGFTHRGGASIIRRK